MVVALLHRIIKSPLVMSGCPFEIQIMVPIALIRIVLARWTVELIILTSLVEAFLGVVLYQSILFALATLLRYELNQSLLLLLAV